MFSTRLPAALAPNAVTRLAAAQRLAGISLLDLTGTNPTTAGIAYPPGITAALADARGAIYDPAPLGARPAREAVARDFARRGETVDPDRVVLCASTSEAYSWLFKCLCDPGDAVLVPQPSYPLFDLLGGLEAVTLRPYRLEDHGVWSIDRPSVAAAVSASTRALLVVTPNNPTGSQLRAADREWLVDFCAGRDLALISDEVFADYPIAPRPDGRSLIGDSEALTFVLGGLSKLAGLPQLKLAWIVVNGPPALVGEAIARLEIVADTFLSVSTPVQVAAPVILARAGEIRGAIAARLATNLAALDARLPAFPAVTLRRPEAGWSAVLEVPSIADEESLVLRLLNEAHVLVHPGYFFDFPAEAFLVVSLLVEPEVFAAGLDRLLPIAAGARE